MILEFGMLFELKLKSKDGLDVPPLAELAALSEAEFRAKFSGSPIKRIGRDQFIRNVLYAIGNSGQPSLASAATPHLNSDNAVVQEAALWATVRLKGTSS